MLELGSYDEELGFAENTDLAWRLIGLLEKGKSSFARSDSELLVVHRAAIETRQQRYQAHRLIAAERLLCQSTVLIFGQTAVLDRLCRS